MINYKKTSTLLLKVVIFIVHAEISATVTGNKATSSSILRTLENALLTIWGILFCLCVQLPRGKSSVRAEFGPKI